MSNSNSQEAYIYTLRRIKETEEKVQEEIEVYRNQVEQEIKNLQEDLKNAINLSKHEGDEMVEKSIEEARNEALIKSDKILSDAGNKSKSISLQLDKKTLKEIMEILFSGMETR
jgi:vacuolar-type H+-ATPase subunit H